MTQFKPTRRELLRFSGMGMMALYMDRGDLLTRTLAASTDYDLYVGTYTSKGGEGIVQCRLKMDTGALQKVDVTRNVDEPSFLATDHQGRFLYAVNELSSYQGKDSGSVSAFAINPKTRALTLINQQASRGAAPCFVSVDESDQFVMVANYGGGSVSVFPIRKDGGVGASTDMQQFSGSGPQPNQDGPHAHQLMTDASNSHALAADLGADKLRIFRFNSTQGELNAGTPAAFSTKPGAGPRHFTFHPGGRFVFLVCELNSTIISLAYDPAQGTLRQVQTVSTLPDSYSGDNAAAEIQVSPNGKFLYASNRGHDSIVVFAIDPDGKLTLVQHAPTRGSWPRSFILDPTGTYLLVANQYSNNIVTFKRDASTGRLTALGPGLSLTSPTSVLVAPPAS